MKTLNLVSSLGSAVGIAIVIGATAACSHEQKHEQAQAQPTAAQQAQTQLENERTAYVNQTQARIDQLNTFSQNLRTKSQTVAKPQDKKLSNAADDLDSFLRDARNSLNEVKTAAPQSWIEYKRDVEKSMDRAENQYNTSLSMIR